MNRLLDALGSRMYIQLSQESHWDGLNVFTKSNEQNTLGVGAYNVSIKNSPAL